jgi:predicted RNA methylase
MSSTNRGVDRSALDYYVTPVQPIVDFLKAAQTDLGPNWRPQKILDPCAGGDPKHQMSYPAALAEIWPQVAAMTLDIREDSRASLVGDYLVEPPPIAPDLIISNPPFGLALEFIQKALIDVSSNGYVAAP